MNRCVRSFMLLAALAMRAFSQEEARFEQFFVDATLRVDYYHVGDKNEELIMLDRVYRQGVWAGSTRQLFDQFRYGRYGVTVRDGATSRALFSRSFNSYFGEYRTTEPAKNGIRRAYHETVLLPFPKRPVRIEIENRDLRNQYHVVASFAVDPSDYHIVTERPERLDSVYQVQVAGPVHEKVDILFIGDGYTRGEQGKFEADLNHYVEVLFAWEPYKRQREKFNVRGIFSPSPESGVSEPRQGRYRHTVLGASFNSLDTDRYLLVEDNKTLRDIAAQAPYDALLVMVNSRRYGGGGLYNDYSTFTSDGPWNEHVMQHEFAHCFAGLGDEYYTKDVAYEEYLEPGVEPNEPNLTALLDPSHLKWRDLVSSGVPIPTEWGQATYDSLTGARDSLGGALVALKERLAKEGRTQEDIAKSSANLEAENRQVNDRLSRFFIDHPLRGKVGAFQGGGYVARGFYRPTVNSLMNAFNSEERTFYPVNERAIERVIDTFTR